ncbi:MAG TPA: hypothetical protein VIC26_03485 [Marinagarivorans sp.]
MTKNTPLKLVALLGASFFFASKSVAHYYLDFSIDNVWLDKQCHLNIEVSNQGEGVPAHFYFSEAPVSVAIEKGDQSEAPLSLTKIDKKQRLVKHGGKVLVKSTQAYPQNPKPVTVSFRYGEEYGDYNQRNNRQIKAIDCELGKGEVAGEPIVYTQPDIAINQINVDAKHCQIHLTLENKTRVPLNADAWGEQGIRIVQKNLQEGSILTRTLLGTLDPEQALNKTSEPLTLTLPIPKTRDDHISINVWYVQNDYDFHNNAIDYSPPRNCR